jgi:Leucine-rich repeat (LRR) protein
MYRMELKKCDFLSILGLRQLNNTQYKLEKTFQAINSSKKEFNKTKIKKKNKNSKFKFNSFVCSFPITTVVQNSFLSNKFYKNFNQPDLIHSLSYENFCQTTNNASPKQASSNKNIVSSIIKIFYL